VKAGNSCIFYDTTTGTNAMNCKTGVGGCVTNVPSDQAGILKGYTTTAGYDLATGLGTVNVANLVTAWPSSSSAPAVTLTPAKLTFAAEAVGSTSAAKVVTVKNSGTAALTLTSETITGTDASSFVISANTCATTLAAGANCKVSVEFKPAASGALDAALSIVDNASGSPQSVSLAGTGSGAKAPAVTLTPASLRLTFPAQTVGSASAAKLVTVENSGTAVLKLTSETITGTNATSFVKSATTCKATLAVGASCTISIESQPTVKGAVSAALSIVDNAAGSPQSVALTGKGK
jgi:hypothetical protein